MTFETLEQSDEEIPLDQQKDNEKEKDKDKDNDKDKDKDPSCGPTSNGGVSGETFSKHQPNDKYYCKDKDKDKDNHCPFSCMLSNGRLKIGC